MYIYIYMYIYISRCLSAPVFALLFFVDPLRSMCPSARLLSSLCLSLSLSLSLSHSLSLGLARVRLCILLN